MWHDPRRMVLRLGLLWSAMGVLSVGGLSSAGVAQELEGMEAAQNHQPRPQIFLLRRNGCIFSTVRADLRSSFVLVAR